MKSEELSLKLDGNMTFRRMTAMVIKLSIPAILAQFTSIAMQYIDAGMVGNMGAHATAAIGLVSTTAWLIGGLCIALSTGFSVQTAQLVGAKRYEDARSVFRQGLLTAAVFGFVLSLVSIGISGPLPVWLGGSESIRADASAYFRIYASVLLAVQIRQLCGACLQCTGDMKTPSMLSILLCVLDVVFNFIFIFPSREIHIFGASVTVLGLGMGVKGAAAGTALAELVVAFLMAYAACVKSPVLALRHGGSRKISVSVYKSAAKISIPSAFEHTIMCSAYVASTLLIAPLGDMSIAANSLAVTAESMCYMPGHGVGTAATALVGQSLGAQKKQLAKKFAHISVMLGMAMMTITGFIMFFIAPAVFGLLTSSEEVRSLGTSVLRIEVFAEPLYAASIVCAGALRGAGDTFVPSILSLISMWGVRITSAAVMIPFFGLHGVWIAMCGELCVRGILFLIRMLRGKWLDKKIIG